MSELLSNAISSLQLGIEDFQSNDPRRPLSAARNYYSGLLLLAKHCIIQAAPDADPEEVIGSNYKPVLDDEGSLNYQSKNKKTVDFHELQERFKDFNLPWPKVPITKLQSMRNDLEHLHPKEPVEKIREAIAQSFPMIDELFKILQQDPVALLGEAWQVMLCEHEFYQHQFEACIATFDAVIWISAITEFEALSCPACGSALVEQKDPTNTQPQEIEGKCRTCGATILGEELVELLVAAQYDFEAYIAAKDGAEDVISNCPECSLETYVSAEEVNGCFWCGEVVSGSCSRCSIGLTPSNLAHDSNSLCSYCSNLLGKDD